MDIKHIIIDNLPNSPWYLTWLPIVTSLTSLIIAVGSLYFTRKTYSINNRPFVWAINYVFIDKFGVMQPVPQMIMYQVKNLPAKIIESKVEITYMDATLFIYSINDFVRFPQGSEWNFNIAKAEFAEILEAHNSNDLKRVISIRYKGINSSKEYSFILKQHFEPANIQWTDDSSDTN